MPNQDKQMKNVSAEKIVMSARFLLIYITLVFVGTLTGCASLGIPNGAAPNATRQPYQEHISLSGRIQVQYQQDDKEQILPANFEWQQNASETNITLLSPLGQIVASIKQDAAGATLRQAKQPDRFATDVDTLLTDALGWSLPIIGLRDWLQGYTQAQRGSLVAIPAINSHEISIDGWKLRFVSWQDNAGRSSPKRIDMQRYTSQAGEVSVRIIIEQ